MLSSKLVTNSFADRSRRRWIGRWRSNRRPRGLVRLTQFLVQRIGWPHNVVIRGAVNQASIARGVTHWQLRDARVGSGCDEKWVRNAAPSKKAKDI